MSHQFVKEVLIWGFILWFLGYVLGILLFFVVPSAWIGYVITPFGIALTYWVLLRKISAYSFFNYVVLGFIWTGIAIVFDYFFIIKLFHPLDGYYKFDVYLYYCVTFILPFIVGWKKQIKSK